MKSRSACSPARVEVLEFRIAPAVIFAVTDDHKLLRFDSNTPGTIESERAITGLAAGEDILGIDFRPTTLGLYALGSTGVLYEIDPGSAKATVVSTDSTALIGDSFGFDFNPAADVLRVVSDLDQNLRILPISGALLSTDTNLAFASGDTNDGDNPNVVGSAYSSNFGSATATTLFGLDSVANVLVVHNPPNSGTLVTVGPLLVNFTATAAFDIQTVGTATNVGFAALSTDDISSGLYAINLVSGAATLLGSIGNGRLITGMTVAPDSFSMLLSGSVVQIYGTPFDDTLIISAEGGLLKHNRATAGDTRFNSDFDFNPGLGGDQTLSASPGQAGLLISGGFGKDVIEINVPGAFAIVDTRFPGDTITGAKGFLTKNSISFRDADGDAAKLTFSKGRLEYGIFGFAAGGNGVSGLQLQSITLTNDSFIGANVTLTAKHTADGGNNSVAVGALFAKGMDLGAVKLAGDLGKLEAGESVVTPLGIKSISVHSIGLYGTTTQAVGGTLDFLLTGSVGALNIRGSVHDAKVVLSGNMDTTLGKVTIGGSLFGFTGVNAASITSPGKIGSVSIGGSMVAKDPGSASILAAGDIGSVKVRGSAIGGGGILSAAVSSASGKVGSVSIGGDWIADSGSSGVFAGTQIGTVKVGGSISSVGAGLVFISAAGNNPSPTLTAAQALAIKNVNIRGSAQNLNILGGYTLFFATHADVTIGSVTVGGDWSRGSIVAGVGDGGNGFGNFGDVEIAGGTAGFISRIASIVIKGQALGTPGGADHYGFVAEHVVSVKIAGRAVTLEPGEKNDTFGTLIGITGDLRTREV